MNGWKSLEILTPEGVRFSIPLAGPVSRMLALAVDVLVVSLAAGVAARLVLLAGFVSQDAAMAAAILVNFILQVGYAIVFEYFWHGQTLGKKILKLRVVDARGLTLQFPQVFIRNILRVVDSIPVFYMVGGLSCLINRKAQRLGDYAANTVVARLEEEKKPDLSRIAAGKFNSLREQRHLAARLRKSVTPQQADLVLQALLRRNSLKPGARLELYRNIAAYFRRLVPYPNEVTESISDEQYLRDLVDVLYRR